jgi:hypothetical protein
VALPSAILAEQQSLSETSRPSSAAGSFDVPPSRLNLALASTPIKESDEERSAALAKMQQTLQATPGAPVRRTTVARGRREARHTMQVESVATMPQLNALANAGKKDEEELSDEVPLAKLAARADAARRLSVSSVGSRNPFDSPLTQQLTGNAGATTAGATAVGAAVGATAVGVASHASRTGESQTTSVKAPAYHVNPPGLRASVVETISAVISQFASKRTTITGEIQLSFLPTELRPTPAAGSALHIRLTAFDALESIQPNGEFLAQVPDMPGEYYLNMDRLAKGSRAAAAAGTGIVLFTYKVLVPDGSETLMLPLALNPAFQLKDGETRMILHYRATSEVPLGQIALSATFDAEPPVTGTQSKPVGSTWSTTTDGKNNCIVLWQPPTPITTNDAKIVARFITSAGSPKLSPLSVDAHFAINHHLISGVNLEVVDSDVPTALSGWKFDSVDRSTVTGQYSGEPIFNP